MGDQVSDELTNSAIGRSGVEGMLRQAPIPPLHDDGVRVFAIGTALFAVASVVLAIGAGTWVLDDWWLSVALTGAGIGVIGTIYCIWRRNKRARDAAMGISAPTA